MVPITVMASILIAFFIRYYWKLKLSKIDNVSTLMPVAIVTKVHSNHMFGILAHLSRRLEWAIVIAHRPSSVRPSVRRRRRRRRRRPSSVRKLFTFSTSSPKPLDGFWWNLVGGWRVAVARYRMICLVLVGMKYSWSLTSVVVFRPDPPRGGSRAGPK